MLQRHLATLIQRACRDCYNQALSNLFNPQVIYHPNSK